MSVWISANILQSHQKNVLLALKDRLGETVDVKKSVHDILMSMIVLLARNLTLTLVDAKPLVNNNAHLVSKEQNPTTAIVSQFKIA